MAYNVALSTEGEHLERPPAVRSPPPAQTARATRPQQQAGAQDDGVRDHPHHWGDDQVLARGDRKPAHRQGELAEVGHAVGDDAGPEAPAEQPQLGEQGAHRFMITTPSVKKTTGGTSQTARTRDSSKKNR